MKLRILHLEDNVDDVELVRNALARQGLDCDIASVSSAPQYTAALDNEQFDVILSDGSLPGYDGRAALAAARDRCPEVPFIVVSGHEPQRSTHGAQTELLNPSAQVSKLELRNLSQVIRDTLAQGQPEMAAPATAGAPDLQQVFASLESRVAESAAELDRRTAELEVVNRELETFSHSIAHDLRSPLITIDGFAQVLLESLGPELAVTDRGHLERISAAVQRMHLLIEDLLSLSRVVRTPLLPTTVDLSRMCREIERRLRAAAPERHAEFLIAGGIEVEGDAGLLRTAMEHLLSNAWKFTQACAMARIEFDASEEPGIGRTLYVRDNGAGFDPRYAQRLFAPFQRLHTPEEFPGRGIGLPTVQRVIHRHGGRIRAAGAVGRGATFYFTLPAVRTG